MTISTDFKPGQPAGRNEQWFGKQILEEISRTPVIRTGDDYQHYFGQLLEMDTRTNADSHPHAISMMFALLLRLGDFEIDHGLSTIEHWSSVADSMLNFQFEAASKGSRGRCGLGVH